MSSLGSETVIAVASWVVEVALHRREQLAARLVVDVLFDLVEQAAAEVLGLFAVFLAEAVDQQFARLLRGDLGEALQFADEVVVLAGVLAGEFRGGERLGFGGGLEPGGLAFLGFRFRMQFGGVDRGFAAGELDLGTEAGVPDRPEGVLAPFGHRIGHDGSGGERHGGEDALVGCHRHVRRDFRRSGGDTLADGAPSASPFGRFALRPARVRGCLRHVPTP
jgi:hypothetical protein